MPKEFVSCLANMISYIWICKCDKLVGNGAIFGTNNIAWYFVHSTLEELYNLGVISVTGNLEYGSWPYG